MECVYCAVRTLILNTFRVLILVFEDRTMAQMVSCRPFPAGPQVRSQISSRGICGGQSDTGTGFSQYFGFPLSLIPPMQLFHLHLRIILNQEDERTKRREFNKKQRVFGSRGALGRKAHLRNTVGCMCSLVSRSHSLRGV